MDEMTLSLDCYRKTRRFVSRQIAGEAVLVPFRQSQGGQDFIYSLNETAASAWALFDGQHSLAEVVAQITAEYEVGEADAAQEVAGLVAELLKLGALEKA